MDNIKFAAKQKRIKQWNEVVQCSVENEELRLKFVNTLKLYRSLIAKCWEAEEVTEHDYNLMLDFERQLEQMNEEARMQVAAK